jgi:hypothetical protein
VPGGQALHTFPSLISLIPHSKHESEKLRYSQYWPSEQGLVLQSTGKNSSVNTALSPPSIAVLYTWRSGTAVAAMVPP